MSRARLSRFTLNSAAATVSALSLQARCSLLGVSHFDPKREADWNYLSVFVEQPPSLGIELRNVASCANFAQYPHGRGWIVPQILRIFISSPSDVAAERRRAALVIEKLAKDYARFFDIKPFLWEIEPMLASGHFQDAIVPPAETDIVVLILWSRLGTPLPERTANQEYRGIDGRAPVTGTEWEFENALAANRRKGLPDLLAYRKRLPPKAEFQSTADLEELGRQWQKLEAFWQRYFADRGEIRAGFGSFDDLDGFETKLEGDLRRLIERRIATSFGAAPTAPTQTWLKGSPFRGLQTYRLEHASIFFGRSEVTKTAVEHLVSNAEAGSPFLLVLGASGAGKSSLAQAGIVPALCTRGVVPGVGAWRCAVMRPGGPEGPFSALAAALIHEDCLPELIAGQDRRELPKHLEAAAAKPGFPIASALAARERAARENGELLSGETIKLVLVVDQLEELLTAVDLPPDRRSAFVTCLQGLMLSGCVFVLATMRSDFWHRASDLPLLVALAEGRGRLDLLPPTQAEIAEMIRRPAEAAGLFFEADPRSDIRLDAALAAEAANEPGVLPLLSFLLDALYAKDVRASGSSVLTYASERLLGGLKGAIAMRAEAVFMSLPAGVQTALPRVLRALVTVSAPAAAPTARAAPIVRFPEASPERQFVEALLDPQTRLLVAEGDGEGARIRLAHEALITHWERGRKQIAQERDDLRTRAVVEGAEAEWSAAAARSKRGYLLRDPQLANALDLARRWEAELGEQTLAFVLASRRQARLLQRLITAAAAIFGFVAIAASVLGVLAYVQWQAGLRSQSLFLAGLANQEIKSGRPAKAMMLAIEALPDTRSGSLTQLLRPFVPQAKAALIAASSDSTWDSSIWLGKTLAGHDGTIDAVRFSHDGSKVLTGTRDGIVRIWDSESGKLLARLYHPCLQAPEDLSPAPSAEELDAFMLNHSKVWSTPFFRCRTYASFLPNDSIITANNTDSKVLLWNLATEQIVQTLDSQKPFWLDSFSLSRRGRDVLVGSARKGILWDVSAGSKKMELAGNFKVSVLSPDGRLIAFVDETAIIVLDLATGKRMSAPSQHSSPVTSIEFSSDTKWLVSRSDDGAVMRWDTTLGSSPIKLKGHNGFIKFVALSSSGHRAITGGNDNALIEWDLVSGQPIEAIGLSDQPEFATLSPDGTRIVGWGSGHSARVWAAEGGMLLATLSGHSEGLTAASFSPTGDALITASSDGTARVWRLMPLQKLIDNARASHLSMCLTSEERRNSFLDPTPPKWCSWLGKPIESIGEGESIWIRGKLWLGALARSIELSR
jgi:WD40 repeat protein